MIEIQDLTLQVNDRILLKDFSATIASGERIGIFGPNGAGKSTFLKGLIGAFPQKTGKILLDGKSTKKQLSKIAYLPQELDVLPMDYSVIGFLTLFIRGNQCGIPFLKNRDIQRCEIALEQVNAAHLKKNLLKNLSGGERKRIMLAALLLGEPEVFLLDEPLANLDPRFQHELLLLIETLQKKLNLTFLITAHDFNPLLHLLDRVMFIGEGKAILNKPEKVIQSDVLSELYQTPLQVVEWNGRKWVLSTNEQELPNTLIESQVFLSPGEHCHGEHCHMDHTNRREQ